MSLETEVRAVIGDDRRAPCATAAWRRLLGTIIGSGLPVAPRGLGTREVMHHTIVYDALRPVVAQPERRLSYRGMATEALWVLDGRDDVKTLVDGGLKRYAEFSDDGVTLRGAYGPRITSQLDWCVAKLVADADTRQAVLTTWQRCPLPSKDVPCTVSMAFAVRAREMHLHVNMRSSDAWLGVPYDAFTFAAVLWAACCRYNLELRRLHKPAVLPGRVAITATSAHLYDANREAAETILAAPFPDDVRCDRDVGCVPTSVFLNGREDMIRDALKGASVGAYTPLVRVLPEPRP